MIDTVYELGDDALDNHAEITVNPFALFGPLANALKYRTTTISIPEFTIGEYEVHWKTQKFPKPAGKDDTPKTFTTGFRVDKYYTVYKSLLAWWQYICNSDSGAMAEDVGAITRTSNIRTDILVKTIDSQGVVTNEGFRFTNAYIKSLAGISYNSEGGTAPITLDITWNFVKMIPIF